MSRRLPTPGCSAPRAPLPRVGARRIRALALLLLLLALAEVGVLARTLAHRADSVKPRRESAAAVRTLGLTDLALWTEARYTRHPALADLFSAFQDHPGALEHFPAGSLLAPPPHLRASAPAAGSER